jgi:hypothetical protein
MRNLRADGERWLSACLFGHRRKLELLAALAQAPDGRINLGALAQERGAAAAEYYPPVRDLMAIRLVAQSPPVTGDRRRWYERSGSEQVWAAVAALARSLHDLGPQTPPDQRPDGRA